MQHPPEVVARVRHLIETTTLTYADIAEETSVPSPTVGTWTRAEGWTRPPGPFRRTPIPQEHRPPAMRILAAGASHHDLAMIIGCHPEVVARLRPRRTVPARVGEGDAGTVPAPVAALYKALTSGAVARPDFFRHTEQALALVAGEALIAQALSPASKAQAIARAAVTMTKLPDDPAPAGASAHDVAYAGPATYDETNALIEELAQRLEEFAARGGDEGVRDEPLARAEAVPQ
jgi:hypothetical protein